MQRVPDKDWMRVRPQQEAMESSVRREILIEPVKADIACNRILQISSDVLHGPKIIVHLHLVILGSVTFIIVDSRLDYP